METMWPTVFIGLQLVAAIIDGKYYISERQMTWTDALSVCKLAKPNITYEDKGESIQIGALKVEQNTWVGYVVQYVVLDYIGCYQNETISSQAVRAYKTPVRVDVCFSACGTSYIAIGGDRSCICINEMETLPSANQISWSKCKLECDNLACGSDNGEYMSVYKDTDNISSTETKPSCFTYDGNMSLESRDCKDKNNIGGFICPLIKEVGLCVVVKSTQKWIDSIKKYPEDCQITAANCSTFVGQGGEIFWSSSVGVRVVRTNQIQSTVKDPKYVLFVDPAGQLQLTSNLDEKYSALCENTDVSTTQSFTPSTVPEVSTTTRVYVGVGIGIAAITTLIVVSVVLRQQIYRLVTRKQKNRETKFTHVTFDNATESHTSGDVAPITPSVSPELPIYFVLEPGSEEATRNQLHQTSISDADDKCNYDVSKQNRPINTQQSANMYNVVEYSDIPSYQGFYDHTNIKGGNGADTNGTTDGNFGSFLAVCDENTYNGHEAGQMIQDRTNRSDNIYDTTCNWMSGGSIYDHTGDTKTRGAADENMYGHISSAVTDKDIDDTYNHI